MQDRTSGKSLALVSFILLAMAIVLFLFFADVEGILLRWLAFFFILLSGLVLVAGIFVLGFMDKNHNKVFLWSGVCSTLFIYFFATFGLGFVSSGFRLGVFVVVNLVVVALTAILVMVFFIVSRNIAQQDADIMGDKAFMDDFERRLLNLHIDPRNAEYSAELHKLYEAVKYADKVGMTDVDFTIETTLGNLEKALAQEGDERAQTDIPAILSEMNTLLVRRKAEMKESKRGGF